MNDTHCALCELNSQNHDNKTKTVMALATELWGNMLYRSTQLKHCFSSLPSRMYSPYRIPSVTLKNLSQLSTAISKHSNNSPFSLE